MINVSQDYLDNIYDDETKTYCTASFGVYDLNAKSQATATANTQLFGTGGVKRYTSSIRPTTWNELVSNLKYNSSNQYGEWVVEADRADSNIYRADYAVNDNNNNSWGTTFNSSHATSTFKLTPPFPIKPVEINVRSRATQGNNYCYYSIWGYNTTTNEWETVIKRRNPYQTTHIDEFNINQSSTVDTHAYTGDSFYSEFKLEIECYNTSSECMALVSNFDITDGYYRTMSPQDSIDGVIGDAENGWTSGYTSNGSGIFTTNPVLIYEWNELHSSAGLQLYFTNKVKQATITYYDGATVVDTYNLSGNADYYEITNAVNDYNKITIEFIEVEPNKPVELQEVNFGIQYILDKEIISIEIEELLDNKMQELPSAKAVIKVNNTTNQYDRYDPSNIMQFLEVGQRVQITNTALINGTPESVPLGVFYLASWGNDTQYTVKFEFTDLMVRLAGRQVTRSKFYSGIETAQTVIDDLFTSYNLTYDNELQYIVDPTIASKQLRGYFEIEDFRTALQKLCIALEAVAYCNREGKIVIKDLTNPTSVETIDYTMKQYSLGEKQNVYNSVTVSSMHTGALSDSETIYSGTINGDATINFESPHITINVTGTYSSYTAYVNCVDIVGASGTITITGRPLETYSSQPITVVGTVDTNTTSTELTVPDILLIDTQAHDVASWLLSESNNRSIKDEFKWLGNPAIEIGDAVSIQYGEDYLTGLIVKNKFTYNGALIETSTVVI